MMEFGKVRMGRASHTWVAVGLVLSIHVFADEAHEHGKAELTLAIEGKLVEVSVHSPAVNLVGFEH